MRRRHPLHADGLGPDISWVPASVEAVFEAPVRLLAQVFDEGILVVSVPEHAVQHGDQSTTQSSSAQRTIVSYPCVMPNPTCAVWLKCGAPGTPGTAYPLTEKSLQAM